MRPGTNMQKKKNLMRLKTRPYYALQGLVQTTGSAGGYDYIRFTFLRDVFYISLRRKILFRGLRKHG